MAQPIAFRHGAKQKNWSSDYKELSKYLSDYSNHPCADAASAQEESCRESMYSTPKLKGMVILYQT